ncbi:MAG TPA: chemotaxis protein CheW [Allocoleopsis sp.]
MAIFSPLRHRKIGARFAENTRQMLVFQLQKEWFAIPIELVKQVVVLKEIYGDPAQNGISLTLYQNKEILVVDVGKRIFPQGKNTEDVKSDEQKYLIILENSQGEIVGLPIDSTPSLKRVPDSAFNPLPSGYISEGNIQCVSNLMIESDEQKPYFLIDVEMLFYPQEITYDFTFNEY